MKKKNVQNLKWATAHLSRRLGVGREGVWQALGVRGRALQAARRVGAAGARACGADGGRAAGARARGACAAGRAAGALLGARSSRGTGAVRAAMHGLGVAWALDGCAGWASWASFGAQCTWLSSDSVFGPGSTRYFPESPNEHYSL